MEKLSCLVVHPPVMNQQETKTAGGGKLGQLAPFSPIFFEGSSNLNDRMDKVLFFAEDVEVTSRNHHGHFRLFFSLRQDVCLQVIHKTSRIRHWRQELFAGFPPSALAESDQGERRNIQMEMR